MIIAVDFDGTIVQHKYPKIGKEIPFATMTLKKLQEEGHRLILWTYRTDELLDEAVHFCESKGIEFYAINKSFPEEKFDGNTPRKIHCDMFIDDRNIGGLPGWGEIYQMINEM
ncbi:BT0820 family HAD-type phosphatase [uncultured Sunxiuqinia sp.]|uniref:BT0820 family HAD-type phosphatase n=1 Tax=uncultured Sunxiuqinia sp. TaxID=1573825 RepID=UPI002AA7B139|nr:hydrolase [uncultured Sunxiuqinia sp.]